MADSVFRMTVFLYLAGLELCGESFYAEPELSEGDKLGVEDINRNLEWMESVMKGTADITVVLRPVDSGEDAPLYTISAESLYDAVSFYTKFLDEPYTLIDCKLNTIHIGSHIYKAPDPMMISLTYEQYQDAQSMLGGIWGIEQGIGQLQKKMESIIQKAQKKKKEPVIPQNMLDEMQELAEDMKTQQAEFLSRLFTIMDVKTEQVTLLDDEGNPIMDKKGKIRTEQKVYHEERAFKSHEAERNVEEFKEHAPSWLFPVMYQWFQSSLQAQQKNFPKLFSGKKGSGESNPLVATISTLNTLMKEQGYQDQQAVLDANAIFNFQKLDALTRQAEEMERMNKKMKSKSRK